MRNLHELFIDQSIWLNISSIKSFTKSLPLTFAFLKSKCLDNFSRPIL